MMAIVGEPSADGLVMEPIELRFGPLATPLPAGIVAEVTLDGDVVAACEVHTLLTGRDLLAPRAWERALRGGGPVALAAAEMERAVSHIAWLRAFARLLGWQGLVDRAAAALAGVLAAPPYEPAHDALADLAAFAERSRRLRLRTSGVAQVSTERAREMGLRGPAARASGLADDARSGDPLYQRLGFEPIVRREGDARARTLVRTAEAAAAIELASRATALDEPDRTGAPVDVEGPRGPLRATDGTRLEAPGEAAALAAAGATAVGAEWAAALTGIASFDLSPWRNETAIVARDEVGP
jgi:Respiratory-chain NADH dehydrogenase, 49 Kd subunit